MPRHRQETIRFLTFDELKRLFNVIRAKGDKRDRAIFLIAYRHGLRASEVGRLHKTDLNPGQDNSPLLFPSRRNLPISRKRLDALIKRYEELAGLPKDKQHF